MRDILVHGYFRVNIDRIWRVVKDDIPILKDHAERILDDVE